MKTFNFYFKLYTILFIFLISSPTFINAALGDSLSTAESLAVPSTTSVSFTYRWGTGNNGGRYYDYKFTVPSDGSIRVYTTGANTDTDVDIYDSGFNYFTGDQTYNNNIDVTFNVTQNSTYILDLYNYNRSNYGNFTLYIVFTSTNNPPIADAGLPQTITLGDSTQLAGSGTDSDGTIASYTWSEGGTTLSNDMNFTYQPSTGGDHTLTLTVTDNDGATGSDTVIITVKSPPTITGIPDETITIENSLSIDLSSYTTEPNGDPITYGATGLPAGMGINTGTGLISGTPTSVGIFNVTAKVSDVDGDDTDDFAITVTAPPVSAVDDSFTTPPNTPLSDNVIGNDSGYNITMTNITVQPSNGTVTYDSGGFFTYTPTVGYTGNDSFTYEITDAFGTTATATATISVVLNTDYQSGVQAFQLINPLNTRNIIGNYIIAGNTVECITTDDGYNDSKTSPSSFVNTCTDSMSYNDNNYMSQYIDIDSDDKTWNSSSSNFNLPTTQSGILWAGLFWQGALHNNAGSYPQRRGYLDSSGNVAYKYITSDESLNMTSTEANKVLLRLDNNTTYSQVQASTFYYDTAHGTKGGYYAAYADITYELQQRNLADGNHTATIANLTATEGRQSGTGNIGGWSLVIIYGESGGGAKARNISIYSGFAKIPSAETVTISGFKLPSSGIVNSTFSAFAGEGEEIYSPDSMFISRFPDLSSPQQMPGAIDTNNIFDARLANIQRDSGNDNDVVNANGIDIEDYNVSNIMTAYRDADENIDTIYIGLTSGGDYITPSMMAFATELYRPSICIDYTVQKNNYDITQDERIVDTRGTGDLSVTLALQSLEGDFDFINTQIGVRMVPTSGTSFDNAYYAPNNVNTLIQAFFTGSSTPTAPMIGIGENVGTSGGTVRRDQRYFARFDYSLTNLYYTGKFEVDLNTTINFGSGEVPSFQSTQYDDIPRCEQNLTYHQEKGSFNIERTDSASYNGATDPTHKYPLYTQVVGKDFDFRLVAYDQNTTPTYTAELPLTDFTIDIELINAAPFNDALGSFTCYNPDPGIIQNLYGTTTNIFAHFPYSPNAASSDVNLSSLNIQTDKALKNAAFRMWYIVDENNTILPHKCTGYNDNGCFQTLYNDHLLASDTTVQADGTVGFCHSACSATAGYNYTNKAGRSGCYACLHDFFSRAVCSRDNFAIRPASYRVQVSDNSQSTVLTASETVIGENDTGFVVPAPFTPTTTLAAGYSYKLDGIATSYVNDTTVARGYNREFKKQTSPALQSALVFDTDTSKNPASCVDKNSTYWDIDFVDGTIKNSTDFTKSNLVKQGDVGYYNYQIVDANWTLVDQDSYPYKPFHGVDDCLVNDSAVAVTGSDKSGCVTDTTLTVNGEEYTDLQILYRPYRFDISNVNYTKHPSTGATLSNGDEYTYLNDLNNSAYYNPAAPLIDMSVSFEGNITALGADDGQLLNFTNLCMANDLSLALSRTTNPDERTALVDSLGNPVLFQQFLQHTSILNPFVDQQEGVDKNMTFPKVAFSENGTSSGVSTMYLHTTFKKPLNTPVNPFRVTYEDLNVTGGLALTSFANQVTHTPLGGKTYDQNLTYLFAKVTPKEFIYQNVLKSFKQTPISVDIFCDGNVTFCNNFDLNTSSLNIDETAEWYSAANIFDSLNDGTTDLVAGTDDGAAASPGVTPNLAVSFSDANASKVDINVTITGSGRPSTVGIDIRPVPWLRYDRDGLNANGYPHYQVQFIDGAGWSGIGNTGQVVETKSSNQAVPRMNW